MPTPDSVLHIIESHGLLFLFLTAVIEGPIATVIGAYVASLGLINIFAVYSVVVLADLVGDTICYLLGRFGHAVILKRWGSRFGFDQMRLSMLEEHFRLSGGKTLLIGKLTHSAGFMILLAAGASKMPFGTFILYNFIGTIPKSLFFLVIGYTLGYAYKDIDVYISEASFGILIVAAAAAFYYFVHKRRTPD